MRALLTCELGAGHGHWSNLRPIAWKLADEGVVVFSVMRDVTIPIGPWRGPPRMVTLPAPRFSAPAPLRHPEARTFCRLLQGVGCHDVEVLVSLLSAWQSIYALMQPGLLICEYSPIALLAARDLPIKKVVIGSGFCLPPSLSPLPDLQFWEPLDAGVLAEEESQLVVRINVALNRCALPRINSLANIFHDVDETFLLTLPELDHYGERNGVEYIGSIDGAISETSSWPVPTSEVKPTVFAYLWPQSTLPELLNSVLSTGCQVVAYIPGLAARLREMFANAPITFLDAPASLADAAKNCSAGILNGSLSTATTLLCNGLPLVIVPTHMEQLATAHRVSDLGLGTWLSPNQPQKMASKLGMVLQNQAYRTRASEFANRYSHLKSDLIRERLFSRLLDIAKN